MTVAQFPDFLTLTISAEIASIKPVPVLAKAVSMARIRNDILPKLAFE